MSFEFDVSFQRAIGSVMDLNARMANLGKELDRMEAKGQKVRSSFGPALQNLALLADRWAKAMEDAGVDSTTASKVAEEGAKRAARSFQSLADASMKVSTQAAVWRDTQMELRKQLADTARDKTYIRFQERISSLSVETAGKVALEKAAIENLGTAQARQLANLVEQRKAKERSLAADGRQAARLSELRDQYERLNTAEAREIAVLETQIRARKKHLMTLAEEATVGESAAAAAERRNRVANNERAIIGQLVRAHREMAITGEQVAWGYDQMSQSAAYWAASQQRAKSAIDSVNKSMVEGEQNLHAYTGANLRAAQAANRLAQQEKTAADRRKSQLSEMRQAIQDRVKAEDAARAAVRTRTQAETQSLEATNRATQGTRAYNNATLRIAESQRTAKDAAGAYASRLELLGKWLARGASAEQFNKQLADTAAYGRQATSSLHMVTEAEARLEARENALASSLERRNAYTRASAASSFRLSSADADLIARTERLQQATSRHNSTLLEEARAAHGVSQAKSELDKIQERELDKLRRLQAQANLLTTDYGRQTAAVERQIQAQREYNRLLTMSTAELIGFSKAGRKTSAQFNASAQAAAMLRAGVTGLHASFGMYTSATILAATATYAFTAAIRDAVVTGTEFTGNIARAEAIMMGSVESYRHVGSEMEALESKVRALGATTSFTAAEVAQGLVDLGMAGLSSSDAMTALEPALRLASIGMIDMGQSADIATNVMTAFDKAADELTDVVDVMATAVTNSNTSIQQLANALSYVGPAANAAGFSMRDTVAAIELLSNAGIKASKAGTGLRRFMLNIQNPSAKGKKVMDELGVAITHADGSTRDLTNILGQFHSALYKDMISPSERAQKVMDLVGVRAQSAVSRLIGSAGEYSNLRNQLDSVTGAAEKMRETIEDFLGGDVKKLRSAFTEIELTAFERMEPVLRRATLEVTAFLQQLNQPIEEGSAISKLDAYIADFFRFGEAALWAAGTFGAWKVLNSASVLTAGFAQNVKKASTTLDVLSSRSLKANTAAHQRNAAAIRAGSTSNQIWSASSIALTGTARGATASLGALAAAARVAGTAISWLARISGWGLVLWGVASAANAAFGTSTQDKIKDHNDLIDESRGRHEALEKQVEKTAQAMKKEAMQLQSQAIKENLESLNETATAYRETMEASEEGSEVYKVAASRLEELSRKGSQYADELKKISEALTGLGSSHEDVSSLEEQQDSLAAAISSTSGYIEVQRKHLADLRSDFSNITSVVAARDVFEALEGTLAFLEGRFVSVGSEIRSTKRDMVDFLEAAKGAFDSGYREQSVISFVDGMSTSRALEYVKSQREEAEAVLEAMQRAEKQGRSFYQLSENGPAVEFGSAQIQEQENILRELGSQRRKLEDEQKKHASDLADAQRELNEAHMSEVSLLSSKRSRLAALKREEEQVYNNAADGANMEGHAENLREQARLTSEIQRIEESLSDERGKSSKELDKYQRRIERLLEQYQRLIASGDDVSAATLKFKDQLHMVNSLLAAGEISQDDYTTALDIMREKFWETVGGADALLGTIQDLNKEWREGGAFGLEAKGGLLQRQEAAARMAGSDNSVEAARGRLNGSRVHDELDDFTSGLVPGYEGDQYADNGFGRAREISDEYSDTERVGGQNLEELRIRQMEAANEDKLELAEEYARMREDTERKLHERLDDLDRQRTQSMLSGASDTFGDLASITAAFAGEQSGIYKAMFATSKAFAIAESIVNIQAAIAKAANLPFPANLGAMATVAAQTASIVGNIQAVSMAVSEGGSGGGGGNYSGQYDTGGTIPRGSYGIVGEVGPEIVHGPAQVTGRKSSERQLKNEGGGNHLEFKPVIQVTVQGSEKGEENSKETGKKIGEQVENKVMQLFHRELRPNGVLERAMRR